MPKNKVAVILAVAASLLMSGPAAAQLLPEGVEPIPDYKAPRFDEDFLDKMRKLPDLNGRWMMSAGDLRRPAEVMFDPEHRFVPPDPAGEEADFGGLVGPLPGSYLTGIPYNEEYRKKYEQIVRDTADGRSIDAVAACRPYGFPRIMGGAPSGPEIVVTPEVVIMTFDQGSSIRHIYTDGRGHPMDDWYDTGIMPRWNGHSIGHWEGDTLVVETIGIIPGYFDQTNPPFSDKLHVVERIRLINHDWLEDQMTLTDPDAFTRPWVVTRYYKRSPEKFRTYRDSECPPDASIDISGGYQRLILPGEMEEAEANGAQLEPQE